MRILCKDISPIIEHKCRLATTVMIRKRKARDEEDDDCDTKGI
jgi:hypothetical protein